MTNQASTTEAELRELDERVAREVMGWLRWDNSDDWNGPEGVTFFAVDTNWMTVYKDGAENPTDYFSPSTDIAAAMSVLDCFSDGPWSITRSDHPSAKDAPYNVYIARHRGGHSSRLDNYEAEAETLPLAICKASLAALSAINSSTEER